MSSICPFCHIGSPKSATGTWARFLGKHLIVLPGISIERCDICGHLEYDPAILARLDALLSAAPGSDPETQADASSQVDPNSLLEDWFINRA